MKPDFNTHADKEKKSLSTIEMIQVENLIAKIGDKSKDVIALLDILQDADEASQEKIKKSLQTRTTRQSKPPGWG